MAKLVKTTIRILLQWCPGLWWLYVPVWAKTLGNRQRPTCLALEPSQAPYWKFDSEIWETGEKNLIHKRVIIFGPFFLTLDSGLIYLGKKWNVEEFADSENVDQANKWIAFHSDSDPTITGHSLYADNQALARARDCPLSANIGHVLESKCQGPVLKWGVQQFKLHLEMNQPVKAWPTSTAKPMYTGPPGLPLANMYRGLGHLTSG